VGGEKGGALNQRENQWEKKEKIYEREERLSSEKGQAGGKRNAKTAHREEEENNVNPLHR